MALLSDILVSDQLKAFCLKVIKVEEGDLGVRLWCIMYV